MNEVLKWKREIYLYLDDDIITAIEKLSSSTISNMTEIRLRCNGAVSLTIGNKNKILYNDDGPIILDSNQIKNVFTKICDGAVYKYENQINKGYITIVGGHRVGFCGTAIYDNNQIIGLKDISSISFRISREIQESADKIIHTIYNGEKVFSTLIVSEPCGGKTTLLTDISRLLSNFGIRVCVIDERSEICAVYNGIAQKNVGKLTDIFNGYSKGEGMMFALRSLSAQVIICDEIGDEKDVTAMLEAMNAGVPVIATAHASCENELMERPQIERLIDHGAIDKIVFLKGSSSPGKIGKVITVNKYYENYWNSDTVC